MQMNELPDDGGAQSDYFHAFLTSAATAGYVDFLLHLAYLPCIRPEWAETLSGRRDAARLLEALQRDSPLLLQQEWPDGAYVVSPAFRQFLIANAASRFTAQMIAALQLQTSTLLERAGIIDNAFYFHAHVAQWDAAVAVVERNGAALLHRNGQRDMLALLQAIPPRERLGSAACQFWLGAALPMAKWQEKLDAYKLACQLYEEEANGELRTARIVLCMAAIISLLCQSESAGPHTLDWMRRLDALLAASRHQLDHAVRLSAYHALTRGLHFTEFNDRAIHRWAVRLTHLLADADHGEDKVKGMTTLLRFYVHYGFLARARDLHLHYAPVAEAAPLAPLTAIWWRIISSEYFYATGQRGRAHDALDQALAMASAAGLAFVEPVIILHKAYTCLSAGDAEAAGGHLVRLAALIAPEALGEQAMFSCALAWHALLRQQPADALGFVQNACVQAEGLAMPMPRYYAELNLTVALMANGDVQKATKQFQKLQHNGHLFKSVFFSPYIRLIGAQLARLRGDHAGSIEALRAAFLAGRESQMLGTIFWLPNLMAESCAHALEHGVEVDFVLSLIKSRSIAPPPDCKVQAWPWPVRIYALGAFAIWREGEEIIFSGKAQRKPLEFLKALIALGCSGVDVFILTHLLWPDAEGDAGQRSFHSTLHRLRKLIGHEDAVRLAGRKVSLNEECCWVDVQEFERIAEFPVPAPAPAAPFEWRALVGRVLAIYRSDFLVLDEAQPWSMPMRDKLHGKFLRFIGKVGDHLEQAGRSDDAIELYQRGLEVDCLAEELYQRLIECRRRRGELAEAFGVYRRCRELLSTILGVAPSDKTTALYRELLAAA